VGSKQHGNVNKSSLKDAVLAFNPWMFRNRFFYQNYNALVHGADGAHGVMKLSLNVEVEHDLKPRG